MKDSAFLFGTVLEQPSLFTSLREQFAEAAGELRRDPGAYIKAALYHDAGGSRRKTLFRFGLATGIVAYAVAFGAILLVWTLTSRTTPAQAHDDSRNRPPIIWAGIPNLPLDGPKDDATSGGGGGGGNHTLTPASAGLPPDASEDRQLFAPTPEPQLKPPALPMPEIIPVDPRFRLRPDDLAPTGLPDSPQITPSAGPGSDRGMGNGEKGGLGDGDGRGLNDGNVEGTGGGTHRRGGMRHDIDSDPVDTRPVARNRPRPNYTEEARKNKIQGTVLARALVGVDGVVKKVTIRRGLADGLNEEAISAVYQMRFTPATRGGQPVASWIELEVAFNLR